MCPNARSRVSAVAVSLALSLWLAPRVEAVDGVVLIDQNRALAGNVTPGDFPGFPVTISRPGSYRLSGNLEVTDPDITAIEITADHVTLDLNGFSIQGPLIAARDSSNRRGVRARPCEVVGSRHTQPADGA